MESKFEYYSRLEDEIIRTYRGAKDEETRNAARMLMKEHQNKMFEWETLDFYEVYRAYREAAEDGNEFLNFDSVFNSEKVNSYVRIMKENGIKHFTYSSTWTNAIKGAWDFEQAGAKLEGLVEINTCYSTKVPALKFTIE
jgi:hypothetical protein